MTFNIIASLCLSYLCGSIPTSYISGRVFYGKDLRNLGSGNLGATNTLRNFGKRAAFVVLLVDIGKGWFPIWYLSGNVEASIGNTWLIACGFSCILGHICSCWVRFKGGKGVATSCGVFLALTPAPAVAAFIVWLVTFSLSKTASIASVVASIVFPILVYFAPGTTNPNLIWISTVLSILILWTHRGNIARMIQGTEKQVL